MNKPTKKLLRCAIYTRKSTEEGLEQTGEEIVDQKRDLGRARHMPEASARVSTCVRPSFLNMKGNVASPWRFAGPPSRGRVFQTR